MRYREAVRYVENVAEMLRTKGGKDGRYYQDRKYVRTACGTAYNGTILALEAFLEIKGKPIERKKGSRVSVDDYRKRLALLDKKLLTNFNTVYNILQLSGYYEGETNYLIIREGLESATEVVNKIRPPDLEMGVARGD